MSLINVMNTKVRQKVSLVLWAASLALLIQAQPLHAMDEEKGDMTGGMPLIQQLTLEDVSEDETLSMSEGSMAQFQEAVNSDNFEQNFKNAGEGIKSTATHVSEWVRELVDPDMERGNLAPMGYALAHVNLGDELAQAQQRLAMLQQPMNLMKQFNDNFPKFLRNIDRLGRNKDRAQRREAAEMKKALAASIASEPKRIAEDK